MTQACTHKKKSLLNLAGATHLDLTACTSKSAEAKIFIFILGKLVSPVSCLREAIIAILDARYQNCSPFPYFKNFPKDGDYQAVADSSSGEAEVLQTVTFMV